MTDTPPNAVPPQVPLTETERQELERLRDENARMRMANVIIRAVTDEAHLGGQHSK